MLTDTVSTNEPTPNDAEPQHHKLVRRSIWRWRTVLIAGIIGLLLIPLLALGVHQVYVMTTCSGLVSSADYTQVVHPAWDAKMTVQGADVLDGGSPASLVQVSQPDRTLSVWVYGCTIRQGHPQLVQLFAEPGLRQGIAKISLQKTLITATLDTSLTPPETVHLQPFEQYLSSEYQWQQGHFIPVSFPGFYPVTSRLEAEALQQRANQDQGVPWHDPITTAVQMSHDLLGWTHVTNQLDAFHWTLDREPYIVWQTTTTAVVEITQEFPHIVLDVTLQRLVQPDQGGLWFVTDARSTETIDLTRPGTLNQPFDTNVHSPVLLAGDGALPDGQTTATLLDHTLTPIWQTNISVANDSTFTGTLLYAPPERSEAGILVIESLPVPENEGIESGEVQLTSVLLN